MHIAIQARFLVRPFSGIGTVTYGLLEALGKIDKKNTYSIFTPAAPTAPLHVPSNFKVIILPETLHGKPWQKPFAGFRKIFWEKYQVPRAVQKRKAELLHVFYPTPLCTTLPTIMTVHDCIPWKDKRYQKSFFSRLVHRATKRAVQAAVHIVSVSEATKKDLIAHGISQAKITVIPNGPDRWVHASTKVDTQKKSYFLYFGGFDPRKNVETVIRVFTEKIAPHYNYDLVIAGGRTHGTKMDAQYEKFGLQKHSHETSMKGDLHYTGTVSDTKLSELLQGAFAFVHLSEDEGFNIPVLDAAVLQKRMIVSDIPAHREILNQSPQARFVSPQNETEITEAFMAAINGQLEPVTAPNGYTWDAAAQKLLSLYVDAYSLLDHSHR